MIVYILSLRDFGLKVSRLLIPSQTHYARELSEVANQRSMSYTPACICLEFVPQLRSKSLCMILASFVRKHS
jgi:hypothetical protein